MIETWLEIGWLRRLLFLSANLAAASVLALLVVLPIHGGFADRDEQIAAQRAALVRLRAVAAQETAVQTASKANSTLEGGNFLPGKNEGVVNADLQTRLKTTIEQAGARLRSVRVVPGQTIDQVRYIGARIEIYGSLPAIHRAIYTIETAKPPLFIAGAVLKPAPPTGKPGVAEDPIIEAQLEVFGATRIEGSSR
jgi:Type II secretion system (T2SS), protein M subtype b